MPHKLNVHEPSATCNSDSKSDVRAKREPDLQVETTESYCDAHRGQRSTAVLLLAVSHLNFNYKVFRITAEIE